MKSSFFKYFILISALILITQATNYLLDFNTLIHNSLADKLTSQQIDNFFEFSSKWQWLSYLLIAIILLIKVSIITSVLYIGVFLFSNMIVTFKQLWNIVITAEFIFLLVPIIKTIWFYFFQTNYALEDVQYFYPLSSLNIIGHKGLEPWLIYPFQTLNFFELGYWLILAYYIGKATETTMDHGLKIVASSYGSALLLWVVVIMFFTLNYS
ncbi:hypothetical protein SAMN05444396_104344 [Flavobacterium segetis]|uniref:Yip1 domain-containing protein n=1 Tax=Flavobacterium segetis TaxID=271157 RepID=A0A1M5H397_9FLAO|nr:hypothetical protein [Flavobacterium segetis]SHG10501.1 hypothetical protein SAMN05444396_104344 [Flavobacterium segetis]